MGDACDRGGAWQGLVGGGDGVGLAGWDSDNRRGAVRGRDRGASWAGRGGRDSVDSGGWGALVWAIGDCLGALGNGLDGGGRGCNHRWGWVGRRDRAASWASSRGGVHGMCGVGGWGWAHGVRRVAIWGRRAGARVRSWATAAVRRRRVAVWSWSATVWSWAAAVRNWGATVRSGSGGGRRRIRSWTVGRRAARAAVWCWRLRAAVRCWRLRAAVRRWAGSLVRSGSVSWSLLRTGRAISTGCWVTIASRLAVTSGLAVALTRGSGNAGHGEKNRSCFEHFYLILTCSCEDGLLVWCCCLKNKTKVWILNNIKRV